MIWRRARRKLLGILVIIALFFPAASHAATNSPSILWATPVGNRIDSCPAIAPDGTIYFGSWEGRLWALTKEGARKWSIRARSEIKAPPCVGDDGTIYFGSRDRKFYAIRTDGIKKWEFKTGAWVDACAAVTADSLYFGSWDKTFYALGLAGNVRWKFPTGGPIVSSAAVDRQGIIYFGSHDGRFYALANDGQKKWEFKAGAPILSSPALSTNGTVLFTSVDGYLHCLGTNGTSLWRLHTSGITESSPVIADNGVVYVGVNRELWAVSADGKKLWFAGNEGEIETAPLLFSDTTGCYVTRWGEWVGFDSQGLATWRHSQGLNGFASPAVGPTGALYLSGGKPWGNLCALGPVPPLAHSPWPKFHGDQRNSGVQK